LRETLPMGLGEALRMCTRRYDVLERALRRFKSWLQQYLLLLLMLLLLLLLLGDHLLMTEMRMRSLYCLLNTFHIQNVFFERKLSLGSNRQGTPLIS
jgi:hypothetical protein